MKTKFTPFLLACAIFCSAAGPVVSDGAGGSREWNLAGAVSQSPSARDAGEADQRLIEISKAVIGDETAVPYKVIEQGDTKYLSIRGLYLCSQKSVKNEQGQPVVQFQCVPGNGIAAAQMNISLPSAP